MMLDRWIGTAPDNHEREFRRAVAIVLTAIAKSPVLPSHLAVKGGILISIAHAGDRFTKDIDFSTSVTISELPVETVIAELAKQLPSAVEQSGFDLDCRIQSHELRPPDPTKSWPTLMIKIGYAPYTDDRRHSRLQKGQSPTVVCVECSYNEKLNYLEELEITSDQKIKAYALEDIIAEKLRALIQQPIRNRNRRQDIYDLCVLIDSHPELDATQAEAILQSLKIKSHSREIEVAQDSLRSSEIRDRSRKEYASLAPEILRDLPDFDEAYERVMKFYESLPW